MADRTSEHLIRIIVQGVNRLGDVVQRGTQAVEKHTKAVQKDDAALKQSARTSKDAQRDYEAFVKAVRDGEKDYDSAREGLKRLAAEMDRLSRKEPVGSKQAEGLHAQAQAARALADQLRRDASERDRLAKESVRVEEQAAAARTRARKKEADDFLGDVRRTLAEEERRRSEAAVRLDRLDAAEAEKRSKRRIDDAVREAQTVAEAARSAPDPRIILGRNVPISRQRPPLIQRVRSFFTQQDSNSLGGFEQQVARADRSASRAATNGFSRLEGAFGRVSRGADGAGFSLAKVDNKFRGLIFVSIIALAQQLISAFVGVAGAAVAVAGAAIQAGEALGGALTAGVAQAIPVLGLVAAAFARIKAVFDAVKLSNLAATKSSYDNATSSDAQAAASDRVASAQEQVVASTQRVKDATVALTDAREQARRKIQDLDQAERDASLQRFDAAQALKRAVATGDVGALEDLRNQRASADTQASRTTADASTARSQGVAGSPDVERAQRELNDATTALAKSRRELDAAGRATTKAADFGAAADRNLAQALAQLDPAERALYQAAIRIHARFKTIFRPITDIIVRSFTRGVDGAEKALGDSRVIKTFTRLADVFASSIDRIRRELTSSRSLNFFQVVGAQAAQNIPLLTTLAIRVERIFQAFALAGGPALHRFIEFFVDLAGQGERATNSQSGIARLEKFFLRGEQMTESFLKLGGAIIQLFAALAGSSAEMGIGLVEDLTRSIQEATVWVKEHQDQVHAFFDDAAKTTEVVAGAIFQVAKAAVSLFDSDKVKAFADVFEGTLLPALTAALGLLSQFTFLLSKVLALPVVGDLAKFALSFFLVGKVIRTLAGIVVPVVEALEGFGAGVVLVGSRLTFLAPIILRVASVLRFAVGILLGPWGLAIAAVVTGIYLLDKRFHFIAPTIKFLGQVFSDVFKAIKKNVVDDTLVPIAHFLGPILSAAFSFAEKAVVKYIDVWAGFVTQMLGGISTLATVASHLPLIGDGARKMFAGLATFVDGFRDKADKAREALRKLNDENAKGPTRVERLQVSVQRLERRLSTLKDGTEDYRRTAIRLAGKQADLNQAMVDAQDAGKKGARGPRAIGSSATDASKAFDSALASMAKGFNSFAGQLGGVKKLNFSAVGAGAGVSGSVSDASKPGVGFAAGGWIGRRGGPQGPDDRIIRVGQGEAVLAVPHQPLVDRALRLHASLVGGPAGLDEMFGRVKGYVGAFASGGRVGGADFGGHPTNVNPFVRRLIAFMQSRFPLSVSSTTDHSLLTTSGNVSDHVGGNAVDLYNASKDVLFRASEYIKKSGLYKSLKQGIHNPNLAVNAGVLQKPPGQFAGAVWAQHADHIHLAIVQALGKIAGGVAGSVSGHIKSPKITGPTGRLKDLLNESIKKIATAANKKLDSTQSTTSVGGSGTSGTGISPGGNVVGNILALAKHAAYVNKVPWNESIERVLLQKESGGGKNLPPHDYGGGLDPSGPMQVISSTFAAYALPGHKNRANPYDNVLAAFNYIKHRYGTLENLAARTGLLGDGYKGYERGGDVPGVGPKASVLHGGEHVWTASEVMRAGGHKVMYALRSMLGGGTQGGPRAYALGGRTLEIGDSLGVGTQGYLKKLIDGLVVNNRGGRASPEALKVLQGLINKSFGRVVFDIGTNDDPPSIFAASLKRLSKIVGDQRELFLNRLHGPGAAEKNKILDAFASANDNVRVINPGLKGLAGDGIHFEAAGYAERARAIAKALGSGGSSPSTSKSEAGYTTPTVFDTSLDGVARQLAAARKAISSIKTRSTKFSTVFARSMEQISGDGGLLDQGTAALERLATSTAARLKRLTYRVTSSGLVVRRTTDQQDAAAQIKGIDQQLSGSQRLRDSAAGDLTDVDRRLAVLRRGGVTSKERKSYETLVAARRSLVAKIATLDGTIADTIESRFQAQEQVIQTGIDAVNQTAQKGLTRADLSDRVATIAEGFVGGSSTAFSIRGGALDQRARILRSQREGLTPLLAQAQAQGNTKLVDDLVGQIEELNVAIAENTAAVAQNSVAARQSRIDDITSAAARASTAADLADRVASVVEASGNSVGAFSLRGRTLLGRRSSISSQRDALSGELARSQSSFGGTTAEQQQIQDLTDQITDLDVQLQENAQAISDNTVAARQSAIDSITGRGGFLGGVFGGLSGIVKALGALAGSEDTKQIASIAQAAGLVLAQTGAGLRDQLLQGFGVDLRGLDPQALVNALRSLNFDGVEANLSVAQRQQFETLIQAVIDNAGAVVDNTQQLADINSTTAQSFSTTAWQLFRQAIFNGSGGLLPQYSLPSMSLTSGLTSSTPSVSSGVAGGSTSLSRPGVVGSETIEVHLTNPTETTDPQWIGEVLAVKRPLARAR